MEFVAFDVETTGLHSDLDDRIVEIGAIRFRDDGTEIGTFSTLVNPGRPCGDSTNIHGITDEELIHAPNEETAVALFQGWLGEPPDAYLAHNATFDVGFVKRAFERTGKLDVLGDHPTVICTLRLSRRINWNARGHRLTMIASHYGIDAGHSHRALDDARTCGKVFLKLLNGQPFREVVRYQEILNL